VLPPPPCSVVVVLVDAVEMVLVVVVVVGLVLCPPGFDLVVVVPWCPVGPVFALGRGTLVVVVALPQPASGIATASARTPSPPQSRGPREAGRAFRVNDRCRRVTLPR
jgi:hypothetical protein